MAPSAGTCFRLFLPVTHVRCHPCRTVAQLQAMPKSEWYIPPKSCSPKERAKIECVKMNAMECSDFFTTSPQSHSSSSAVQEAPSPHPCPSSFSAPRSVALAARWASECRSCPASFSSPAASSHCSHRSSLLRPVLCPSLTLICSSSASARDPIVRSKSSADVVNGLPPR